MAEDLQQGDRVYNPRYGRGEVIRSERIADYQKVTIRFETGQEVTLRDPTALHLERLEAAPRSPRVPSPPPPEEHHEPQQEEPEMDREELRSLLRETLEEFHGPADAELGDRWRNGTLVLRPGREGTQSKEIPIEKLFQKVTRIRDQLRVLELKINSHRGLTSEDKVTMQQYITRCYGTLTTFNVLFKDAADRFVGSSGGD